MTKMEDFTIDQLMLFIGGVSASIVSILLATQKSKCKKCCFGCIERDVNAVIEEEKLEMTGHTGSTPQPRRSPRLQEKEIKLELNNNVEDEKP